VSLPNVLTEDEIRIVTDALVGGPGWLELARVLEAGADVEGSDGLRTLSLGFEPGAFGEERSTRAISKAGIRPLFAGSARGTVGPCDCHTL